jgi:hypothetical protein
VLIAALLVAAQAAFLWMFFSADALDQAAGADRVMRRFASGWRHGTAGNTWLYMPGFFVTAAAAWLAAPRLGRRRVAGWIAAVGAAAAIAAVLAATLGTRLMLDDFARATGRSPSIVPTVSPLGALRGLYTLAAWTVFVLACRRALIERTLHPFIAPAILAVGLVLMRPWTLGEVGGDWMTHASGGDPIAWLSAAAVPALATLLAVSVQCSQRRIKPLWPKLTRRASTTTKA